MGTTVKNVILSLAEDGLPLGRKGAARRDQTASALKGKRNSMEDPARSGVRIALTVPWIW